MRGVIAALKRAAADEDVRAVVVASAVAKRFCAGLDITELTGPAPDAIRTLVLKFHLRISKKEQRKRFLARLNEPEKRWKFSASDITERAYWDDYMAAYEEMIRETSTEFAPWYVIPANHKHIAWVIASAAIVEAIEALKPNFPKIRGEALKDLKKAERALRAEGD